MRNAILILTACGSLTLSVIACSDDAASGGGGASSGTQSTTGGNSTGNNSGGNNTGGNNTGGNNTGGNSGTTGASTGSVLPPPTEVAECQGKIYECGDLIDNDGDGLVDYQDPDCLGPCDNTEDSLYGGIPGQNNAPCKQDCYWDQDTGNNDDCYWSHECDPFEVAPNYYPEPSKGAGCEYQGPNHNITPVMQTCSELQATQSTECHDYCGPLTPNGCDCFGCCELPAGSGAFVWMGSQGASGNTECTWDQIANPALCHPCTPVAGCLNDCAPCELCLGKTTLPPECGPSGAGGGGGGPIPLCPTGVQACGVAGLPACPGGFYCITGCCQAEPQ